MYKGSVGIGVWVIVYQKYVLDVGKGIRWTRTASVLPRLVGVWRLVVVHVRSVGRGLCSTTEYACLGTATVIPKLTLQDACNVTLDTLWCLRAYATLKTA